LWRPGSIPVNSYASIAYQLKLSGFTGLRLPFTFESLKSSNRTSKMAAGVDERQLQQPFATSSLGHYLWVVQWFVSNGMYVILDYCHPQTSSTATSTHSADAELTPEGFANNWTWLWAAVTCLPSFPSNLQVCCSNSANDGMMLAVTA
jgi:aryl-phospho-beta-D-glucosidase BglC (GH1 family)